MPRALVFGDINVDLLARLPAPLAVGGDNLHPAFEMQLGGVGANTAVALRKLGAAARLLGCAGNDWLGEYALRALGEQQIDVSCVRRGEDVTGLVVIPIDPDGQRTILGARGANRYAPQISAGDSFKDVDALHVVGYMFLSQPTQTLARTLITEARRRGLMTSLDAGPAPSREAREAILACAPELDALFVSLAEVELLTRTTGAPALEAIAGCGAREIVLKRGEAGCQFLQSGRWWMVPPLAVDAVDTTGSGDAFAAGYLFARMKKWSVTDAALLANAMGAAAATVLGAGAKMPGREEVMRLLEQDASSSASARLLGLLRGGKSSATVG